MQKESLLLFLPNSLVFRESMESKAGSTVIAWLNLNLLKKIRLSTNNWIKYCLVIFNRSRLCYEITSQNWENQ